MSGADEEEAAAEDGFEALARRALERYELDVVRLTLIADDWNCTFKVETADGDTFALRVNLPMRRSDDEIRIELAWLEDLAVASGVRVPRPMRSKEGSLFVQAEDVGVPEPRRVAVFTWIPGDRLGEDPDPRLVAGLGEGVARLHEHGRAFQPTAGLRLWDSPFPHEDGASLFDEANADVVQPSERAVFERAVEATREAIERLGAADEPMRIVHGDIHQDNVLVGAAGLWFIDFDDCMLAWPVQDLGVTMWEVGEDEAASPYREALREGYEGVVPWPERWPGEIDIFAADRGLIKIGGQVHQRAGTDREELHASVQRHAAVISWYLERADALR